MAETSTIEWTDATWNPITGCTMVSAGCTNCYAMGLAATRLRNHPSRAGLTRESGGRAVWTGEVRFNDQWLDQPLRWSRPRKIFVCAHGDLFHESVPDEWIDRVFAVMALAPQHTFQVLTKRPERARVYMDGLGGGHSLDIMVRAGGRLLRAAENATRNTPRLRYDFNRRWPLKHIWLGTSIEDQATANARIPHLMDTPAAVRFLSAEPLLGSIDLTEATRRSLRHPSYMNLNLHWVIVGGESGPGARPMHPDWARSLRDQCQAAGVAFHFKQWGEWAPALQDPEHDGYVLRQTEHVGAFDSWKAAVFDPDQIAGVNWRRLGKKVAGRQLDGRTWDEVPA